MFVRTLLKPRVGIFLAIIAVVWAVAAWCALATGSDAAALLATTDRRDYLASLNNRTYVGCLMIRHVRPEFVVVGDSHAYAGIDYPLLGDALGVENVGACALPGAYFESVLTLFEAWRDESYAPRRMMLSVGYRMFVDGASRSSRRDQHRELLFDHQLRQTQVHRWVVAEANGQPAFGDTYAAYRARQERHRTAIEALDLGAIRGALDDANSGQPAIWRDEVPTWSALNKTNADIDRFCAEVRRLRIVLDVVHFPETPFAEGFYTDAQHAEYERILARLQGCARRVVWRSTAEWGLDERHFVNRRLEDDYDYGLWGVTDLDTLDRAPIDLDHLNAVGAYEFTVRLNQVLGYGAAVQDAPQ